MGTSTCVTEGIRVSVESRFVPQRSDAEAGYYFFAYTVRISNEGHSPAQLESRHWIITRANGSTEEVRGPGVVGHTPLLAPGEAFEYTSFCPLDCEFGTMHGSYLMVREDGRRFHAAIAPFVLATPTAIN